MALRTMRWGAPASICDQAKAPVALKPPGVVEITSGCQPGDELVFTDQNGIAGNNNGCELRLLGTATVAQYQQAVRSISFRNLLSGASGDRVIAVTLRDQAQFSRPAAVRLHFMP